MNFEFATASRIIFGAGTIQQVAPFASELGKNAFIITGSSIERAESLLDILKSENVLSEVFKISQEPTIEITLEGINHARRTNCDMVIGIGGGSVIDAGKAIAALLTNQGDLVDYLEVIGNGKKFDNPSAPYIAIPTTAGTGAEVTKNAVLASQKHKVKISMRSNFMLPKLAVVDPELTYSMPPEITASTGLDAFTQLLEAFVSNKANPITDGICREGLSRVARSLEVAYKEGKNKLAREDMSLASLFGGLALTNAKLGAVHGFAGPLGGLFSAPHGVICAKLLPFVMETNVLALQEREPENSILHKFDEVAKIATSRCSANASDGVEWIQQLCEKLNIPPLSKYGLREEDIQIIVEKSKNASSMKGNPIELMEEELTEILKKAI